MLLQAALNRLPWWKRVLKVLDDKLAEWHFRLP